MSLQDSLYSEDVEHDITVFARYKTRKRYDKLDLYLIFTWRDRLDDVGIVSIPTPVHNIASRACVSLRYFPQMTRRRDAYLSL